MDEIWKSVSQMWGLALADFGRDPRSSDSLRGIVFPKKNTNLLGKFPDLSTLGRHNSVMITNDNKNSSADKIANVNFLRRYRTRTSEYQKENLLRLTN